MRDWVLTSLIAIMCLLIGAFSILVITREEPIDKPDTPLQCNQQTVIIVYGTTSH